ncbi:MAG: hypothetical protein NZM04_02500 [Methylacidiphilales bacterium]|nr:hypothetical protein [Candidatus Methylacidiphilales bacterium]
MSYEDTTSQVENGLLSQLKNAPLLALRKKAAELISSYKIKKINKDVVDIFYETDDEEIRRIIARVLLESDKDKAISVVVDYINKNKGVNNAEYIKLIVMYGGQSITSILADILFDLTHSKETRSACATIIGENRFYHLSHLLRKGLIHEEYGIQECCAHALALLNDKQSCAALIFTINNTDDFTIKKSCLQALFAIDPLLATYNSLSWIKKSDNDQWTATLLMYLGINYQPNFMLYFEMFAKLLNHQNTDIRTYAAVLLGRMINEKTAETFLDKMKTEKSYTVNLELAKALIDSGYGDKLIRLMESDLFNRDAILACIRAMQICEYQAGFNLLKHMIYNSKDLDILFCAIEAAPKLNTMMGINIITNLLESIINKRPFDFDDQSINLILNKLLSTIGLYGDIQHLEILLNILEMPLHDKHKIICARSINDILMRNKDTIMKTNEKNEQHNERIYKEKARMFIMRLDRILTECPPSILIEAMDVMKTFHIGISALFNVLSLHEKDDSTRDLLLNLSNQQVYILIDALIKKFEHSENLKLRKTCGEVLSKYIDDKTVRRVFIDLSFHETDFEIKLLSLRALISGGCLEVIPILHAQILREDDPERLSQYAEVILKEGVYNIENIYQRLVQSDISNDLKIGLNRILNERRIMIKQNDHSQNILP